MSRTETNPEVLIVGAGPTGLAIAGLLARAGISIRIIDKNSARSENSKALGVQAGTLEALGDVFGKELPEKMAEAGLKARSACLHIGRNDAVHVDLSQIPSVYNFVLILAQSETERFLEDQLASYGVRVERGHELVSLKQSKSEVECQIANAGRLQTVAARYVIGCDGAHSEVRHQLEMPFRGGAYDGNFVLGDVKIEWQRKYDEVHLFVSEKGAMACFPMAGEQRYRIVLIPKPAPSDNESIDLAEFQNLAKELSSEPVRFTDPVWLTRFRVSHRMVKSFRKGNVFLAGDAAHIHSPAGGQGMNTGIQDGLYLGARLVNVLRGGAHSKTLDAYERARLPIAKGILRGTDFVTRLALLPENFVVSSLRNFLVPKVVSNRLIQKRIVKAISEVSVARRERAVRLFENRHR